MRPSGKAVDGADLAGDWMFHPADAEGAEKTTLASFQQQKIATADGKVR